LEGLLAGKYLVIVAGVYLTSAVSKWKKKSEEKKRKKTKLLLLLHRSCSVRLRKEVNTKHL